MPCISYRFQVNAPLEAVSFFHRDTRALKKLTPPPVIVRLRRVEPLAEGSVSEFTLWFGPPLLKLMLAYRKLVIRRETQMQHA
jgi:ligand-binding SRPBCC domain-containing protein